MNGQSMNPECLGHSTYLCHGCKLRQHIQYDVHEASVQEDRSDESANDEFNRNPKVVVGVPPPLIGLPTMESSGTTEFLNSTKSIWWVGSVIKTWQGIRVFNISRGTGKPGLAHMAAVVLPAQQKRSSCTAENERRL